MSSTEVSSVSKKKPKLSSITLRAVEDAVEEAVEEANAPADGQLTDFAATKNTRPQPPAVSSVSKKKPKLSTITLRAVEDAVEEAVEEANAPADGQLTDFAATKNTGPQPPAGLTHNNSESDLLYTEFVQLLRDFPSSEEPNYFDESSSDEEDLYFEGLSDEEKPQYICLPNGQEKF